MDVALAHPWSFEALPEAADGDGYAASTSRQADKQIDGQTDGQINKQTCGQTILQKMEVYGQKDTQ